MDKLAGEVWKGKFGLCFTCSCGIHLSKYHLPVGCKVWLYLLYKVNLKFLDLKSFLFIPLEPFLAWSFPAWLPIKELVCDSEQLCLVHSRHPVRTQEVELLYAVAPIEINPRAYFTDAFWTSDAFHSFLVFVCLFVFSAPDFRSWMHKCSVTELRLWLVPLGDHEATILMC